MDEDTTQVEYRRFHDMNGSIYPSFSFCFIKPVLNTRQVWEKRNNYQMAENYRKFLSGNLFDKRFFKVDYDEVTKDLFYKKKNKMYIYEMKLRFRKGGKIRWAIRNGQLNFTHGYKTKMEYHQDENQNWKEKKVNIPLSAEKNAKIQAPNVYISVRKPQKKCYSFNTPFIANEKIEGWTLAINPEFFGKYHLKKVPLEQQFSVHFHYPYQTRNFLSTFVPSDKEYYNSSMRYHMNYYLSNIEVLKRRNKRSRPCIEGPYDDKIIQKTIKRIGCAPAFLKAKNTTTLCNGMDYLAFIDELKEKDHPPPCKTIKSMDEWHKTSKKEICTKFHTQKCTRYETLKKILIHIHFLDDVFKEIVYTKVYSLESLVANIGGYVGKLNKIYERAY